MRVGTVLSQIQKGVEQDTGISWVKPERAIKDSEAFQTFIVRSFDNGLTIRDPDGSAWERDSPIEEPGGWRYCLNLQMFWSIELELSLKMPMDLVLATVQIADSVV